MEAELSSAESDHRLAVVGYRQHVEELSLELRSLQVVVDEQKCCSDEVAAMALELEKERGRMAGLCISVFHCLVFVTVPKRRWDLEVRSCVHSWLLELLIALKLLADPPCEGKL